MLRCWPAPPSKVRLSSKIWRRRHVWVVWAKPILGRNALFLRAFRMLLGSAYDLIHSQGFISAFHASVANAVFRIPHVLTIHGILEKKYIRGVVGRIKRLVLELAFQNITVFHGVGNDILAHFREEFPRLTRGRARWEVICNGIITSRFAQGAPGARENLKRQLTVAQDAVVFGFFGRFMPQKGFNYIIDAVDMLKNETESFLVMAVGSGDYQEMYRSEVERRGIQDFIRFLPFTRDISTLIKGCDAVLMPSIWEAYGLLAAEVLSAGIPLIASECIGLRETIKKTPSIRIPPHDSEALTRAMAQVTSEPDLVTRFRVFQLEAIKRFDVSKSAQAIAELFMEVGDRNNPRMS